ncbi:MAG: DUF3180 family protein [Varibaculum sp.]|nr:DUF3180 family protein [Varibaculum sp.]
MRRIRFWVLAVIVVFTWVVSAAALLVVIRGGGTPMLIQPAAAGVVFLLIVPLLLAGREVRRLKRHEKTRMTPIAAAQVALAAQSVELVGAAVLGYLAAQVMVAVLGADTSLMARQLLGSVLALVAMFVLVVAAHIVEGWCVIDDEDEHGAASGSPASPAPAC